MLAFAPRRWYRRENANTLIGAAILKSGHPYIWATLRAHNLHEFVNEFSYYIMVKAGVQEFFLEGEGMQACLIWFTCMVPIIAMSMIILSAHTGVQGVHNKLYWWGWTTMYCDDTQSCLWWDHTSWPLSTCHTHGSKRTWQHNIN